jgi:hypothetical protein
MNSETLKKTLASLHQELGSASTLDEKSRQRLQVLMRDLDALGTSAGSGPDTLHRQRVEELAVEFEVDHPTLAAVLRQLIDLLGKAGL